MKRVLLVFGTRPEVVSLAPVYDAMKQRGNWEVFTACTAQHREILDQMLVYFDIQSNYDLNIMTPSQDLFDITSKVLLGLRSVLRDCKPDLVVVEGGTASAMAAAMAAFYLEIPVAHVDAGLRTWDMHNPFPEEINGWIADAVSSIHFAPTKMARDFLIRNGFAPTSVHVTGSPAVDSLRIALKAIKDDPFRAVSFQDDQFIILLTGHRRESVGAPLTRVFQAIRTVTDRFDQVHVVFPVHANPRIQQTAHEVLGNHERIHLLPPQSYPEYVKLLRDCHLVVTDSGGIQQDAVTLRKHTLVLRRVSERPESTDDSTAVLVGTDPKHITLEIENAVSGPRHMRNLHTMETIYGTGDAAKRIVDILARGLPQKDARHIEPPSVDAVS